MIWFMTAMHKNLSDGRWHNFSLMEQLAHIGSEVDRAIYWRQKNDIESSRNAADRALELLDLTLADERWRHRLKELARAREVLCDYFYGENMYNSFDVSLKKYFLSFGIAANKFR